MPGQTTPHTLLGPGLSTSQIRDIASTGYVYGYPLVLMDVTRQVVTNVAEAGQSDAPANQFANMRAFPDENMNKVVSPNADTLYTFAFLDLSKEPMILSVPDMHGRYYLMQMLDGWTNVFACPGTRTTGSSRADFVVVGPHKTGPLPDGVNVIKSPTSMVWIIGRTQTNGRDDYAAVHAVQDQYKLTPLSAWGKPFTPATNLPTDMTIDMKTPPVDQVAKLDANAFFQRLNLLMKDNPPTKEDAPMLEQLSKAGIAPGKAFDLNSYQPEVAKSIEEGFEAGRVKVAAEARGERGRNLNGWEFMTDIGQYGTDYLWRAVVALVGLGANLPEDAIYPRATRDSDGNPLSGSNCYEIHFEDGQLPPVGAFWSITLYNSSQFFVKNPINRFAIGDRDKLAVNEDGSLTIFVQHDSPGKSRESNWLPAPEDSFNLFMRLYWPKRQILDGIWRPPAVKRVAAAARRVA